MSNPEQGVRDSVREAPAEIPPLGREIVTPLRGSRGRPVHARGLEWTPYAASGKLETKEIPLPDCPLLTAARRSATVFKSIASGWNPLGRSLGRGASEGTR